MKLQLLSCPTLLATSVALSVAFNATANTESSANDDVEHIEVRQQKQAYRGDVPLRALPQSISIVSGELLEDSGIVSFQDALDFASGIVRQNGFGGLWDGFAIRGFAGDENLPSGYLVNGFSAGRGFSGRRNTANIQSIEILKGPGSALYGRSEPGGTVNIITKKPQFDRQGYIKVSAGNYDATQVEADYTDALTEDFAYRVNGFYDDSGSFRDHIDSKSISANPSFLWNISDTTSLTYEMEYLDQKTPFDRGIVVVDNNFNTIPADRFLGEPDDGDMHVEATGHQMVLQHQINENWDILAGLGLRESSFNGFSSDSRLRGPETDGTLLRQRRQRDFDASDLSARIELSGNIEMGSMTHHLLIGFDTYDYEIDMLQSRFRSNDYTINIFDPVYATTELPEVASFSDRLEEQESIGVYIQDQIDLTDQWKLLVGVRFDEFEQSVTNNAAGTTFSQDQSEVSPRLGVVYQANQNMTLYVSYAEGFRPNSGADFSGKTFDPEVSESTEIGIKFNNNAETISGTLAYYKAEKSNIITSDLANPGFSAALGEAESSGIELDLTAYIGDNTTLTVAYAYTDAKTLNTVTNADWGVEIPAGSPLINIAENTANATLQHSFNLVGKESNIGVSYNYVGERLGETITPSYLLPSHSLVRLFGSVNLTDNVIIMFDVDNLLDEEYISNSYHRDWTMPGTPRNYRISAKYQF